MHIGLAILLHVYLHVDMPSVAFMHGNIHEIQFAVTIATCLSACPILLHVYLHVGMPFNSYMHACGNVHEIQFTATCLSVCPILLNR